jgi:hypothetical protein
LYLKQRKASTDPRLRSLLQKAVRRGFSEVVDKTARRLNEIGDKVWLRSRTIVITFEECWPLAHRLALKRDVDTRIDMLLQVTHALKHKDAAGLGAMAYAYHEGDKSMTTEFADERPLQLLAKALDGPEPFFSQTESQCTTDEQRTIVIAARKYLAAATWGWDKACILAGAFLASSNDIPSTMVTGLRPLGEFPYWVALDKHTPQGKEALRALSVQLGLSYRQLLWSSFYFESAITDTLGASPWWEAEKAWRLRKAGLTVQSAEAQWQKVQPLFKERIALEAANLRSMVELNRVDQAEMFSNSEKQL